MSEAQVKQAKEKSYYDYFPPRTREDALKKTFRFWDTQPVTKFTDCVTVPGPINKEVTKSETVTKLPKGYTFESTTSLTAEKLTELCDFLNSYYIEDSTAEFRRQYTVEELEWAFYGRNSIVVSVYRDEPKKLVGVVTGTTATYQINQDQVVAADVNYLCVHPKYRHKRLTPVMLREITRLFHFQDVKQAVYTVDRYVPSPFCEVETHHRPINFTRLVETGFCSLDPNTSLERQIDYYKIKTNLEEMHKGMALDGDDNKFVPFDPVHLENLYRIFTNYLKRYTFHQNYTIDEFAQFLSHPSANTYVFLDNITKLPIDFITYYTADLKVVKTGETVKEAHIMFYSCKRYTIYELITGLFAVLDEQGIDVLELTNTMENGESIPFLKCIQSNNLVNYHCYNWNNVQVLPCQIANPRF